uniref:Uncharacterized protein n=1 Tax=Rhizophora mucronata TaxID=61149 RepID=A0A2P2QN72_RHIMU
MQRGKRVNMGFYTSHSCVHIRFRVQGRRRWFQCDMFFVK